MLVCMYFFYPTLTTFCVCCFCGGVQWFGRLSGIPDILLYPTLTTFSVCCFCGGVQWFGKYMLVCMYFFYPTLTTFSVCVVVLGPQMAKWTSSSSTSSQGRMACVW